VAFYQIDCANWYQVAGSISILWPFHLLFNMKAFFKDHSLPAQNGKQETWNLFVLYNKETNYYSFFLFQNLSQLPESRPLSTSANTKNAI